MNEYKRVEAMLYNYKDTLVEIKNIKLTIDTIKLDIKGVSAIGYDDMPKAHSVQSSVENEVMQRQTKIENLTRLLYKKENEIAKINNVLESLEPLERYIIESYYFHKKTNVWIGIEKEIAEQTVCKKKIDTINKMIRLLLF